MPSVATYVELSYSVMEPVTNDEAEDCSDDGREIEEA